jgi:hypothetical protein
MHTPSLTSATHREGYRHDEAVVERFWKSVEAEAVLPRGHPSVAAGSIT